MCQVFGPVSTVGQGKGSVYLRGRGTRNTSWEPVRVTWRLRKGRRKQRTEKTERQRGGKEEGRKDLMEHVWV